MTGSWTRLMSGIVHSTVWQNPLHVKVVWITLLAMKDDKGMVYTSMPGLAHTAGVTLEQCKEAIDQFLAPDPYSSSQEFEGRRIEKVDRGFFVLNHFKFRDWKEDGLRQKNREKQARYRERQKVGRLFLGPNISKTLVESNEHQNRLAEEGRGPLD